ncbi:PF09939 family protein [Acinetobacter sp. WC-743]|nr:PF09939 family protein [Acinetobacter sp. WC-743]
MFRWSCSVSFSFQDSLRSLGYGEYSNHISIGKNEMTSINVESIKNHADVIAACGTKVGEVDHLVGTDQIKLTKHGDGHHHLIPTSWVGQIQDQKVILTKDSQEVKDTWIEV